MGIDYKNRKYDIVPYSPKWKDQFDGEAKILSSIFGDSAIAIEHVGSTAVPGLSGKPTIDVLLLVEDIAIAEILKSKMEEVGYKSLGEYVSPGTRLFVKEENNTRISNIHIFPKDHPHAKEMLLLRDYFRKRPELVEEYSRLKFELLAKYPDDYGSYRKYKDEWMENLKDKMRKEFASNE